jgi:hypothetical protein
MSSPGVPPGVSRRNAGHPRQAAGRQVFRKSSCAVPRPEFPDGTAKLQNQRTTPALVVQGCRVLICVGLCRVPVCLRSVPRNIETSRDTSSSPAYGRARHCAPPRSVAISVFVCLIFHEFDIFDVFREFERTPAEVWKSAGEEGGVVVRAGAGRGCHPRGYPREFPGGTPGTHGRPRAARSSGRALVQCRVRSSLTARRSCKTSELHPPS